MNRRTIGRDPELTFRMFLTMFLLAVVYLAFMTVLWAAGAPFMFIIIMAAVMLGIQYYFSDKMVLWAMRAKEVTEQQEPWLHATVERLAVLAGIPKPRIAVSDMDIPNAFATGRDPQHSVVAVTKGIQGRLSPEELEAVLAHELSHVRNRDVTVITMASFFATVASLIMQNFFFISMVGGDRRDRNSGGALMLVFLASILVYLISFFLIRALSRYREYAADRSGALLTGHPEHLSTALMRISGTMQTIPQEDMRRVEQMNAFFIIPALQGASLAELTSTHPSLENRIKRLEILQRQMEGH
jgi:heat shock protein HtpX